jgi:hypothetical protein
MRFLFVLIVLAGCGADDPPFVPTASAGISAGTAGIGTNTALGVSNGALSLGVNL